MNDHASDGSDPLSAPGTYTATNAVRELGDFTTTPRVIWITSLALGIDIISGARRVRPPTPQRGGVSTNEPGIRNR